MDMENTSAERSVRLSKILTTLDSLCIRSRRSYLPFNRIRSSTMHRQLIQCDNYNRIHWLCKEMKYRDSLFFIKFTTLTGGKGLHFHLTNNFDKSCLRSQIIDIIYNMRYRQTNDRFKTLCQKVDLKIKLKKLREGKSLHSKAPRKQRITFDLEKFIEQNDLKKIQVQSQREKNYQAMDQLVQKLGYLDYRDLLAAYRYVLEAKRHDDYKIRTRAELLNYALKKMNEDKIQKIRDRAEELKQLNPTADLQDVGSTNQEQFIKFSDQFNIDKNDTQLRAYLQDPFLRKVYKQIYITQKASSESERAYYEKKYKEIEQLSEHASSVVFQKQSSSTKKFPKDKYDKQYFSKIVEGLKPETRKKLGIPNKYDQDISDEQFARVWREWKQYATPVIITQDEIRRQNLQREKQMSSQIGSQRNQHELYLSQSRIKNLDEIKKIPYKLRRDMIQLRRAYAKSKLKMQDVMKEDAFFDQIPIQENGEINQIQDNSIIQLNSIARGLLFPTPGRYNRTLTGARDSQLAKFENQFKKKYFQAKFRYYCSKVLRKYDRILSGQESEVELYKPHKDSKEKMQLMREYMYQNIDWSSDRSRIRKKLLQNRANRMTLKDIGKTLDEFIIKDKMDSNEDILKLQQQSEFRKINKPIKEKEKKWTDDIMKNFKPIKPLFLDNPQELDKLLPEDKKAYEDVITQVKRKEKSDQVMQSNLTEDQKYQIELFHAFKTDPYFQHYLKYDKEKFEEERKSLIVEPPSLELKAIVRKLFICYIIIKHQKLKEFLQFNNPKQISFLQDLSEKSYKRVVINGKSFGSGIRKSCKAFAIVSQGDGKITINGKNWIKYFPDGSIFRSRVIHAVLLSNLPSMVNIDIRVKGGGVMGQSSAIRLAVSRALANYMPAFREDLQKEGYLKTDPRKVESKRIGKLKARKSQVYRRR